MKHVHRLLHTTNPRITRGLEKWGLFYFIKRNLQRSISRFSVLGMMIGFVLLPVIAPVSTPATSNKASLTSTSARLPAGGPVVTLDFVAGGFDQPTDIANSGVPGDSRLFVVEQSGLIRIIAAPGNVLPAPFLNIQGRVGSSGSEQGLLGLVFHPYYGSNGYFYVNYTDNNGDTVITRFQVSPSDPNLADPGSEFVILRVDQPYPNHNAGDLAFGPDGYLYIPLGDGGSAGDPQDRAQDLSFLLGKLLRIDVGRAIPPIPGPSVNLYLPMVIGPGPGAPYSVPDDNPFVGQPNVRPEIWALGMRNPWRISFDRQTGDLFIGDVGQSSWEEIDYQPADSTGGENYGWRCYEGNHAYNPSGCGPMGDYTFPIHEYSRSLGSTVTGGFVYRGSQSPALDGYYVFADFGSGRFWSLNSDGFGNWLLTSHGVLLQNPSTFGEGVDSELYVAGYGNGNVYQIAADTP